MTSGAKNQKDPPALRAMADQLAREKARLSSDAVESLSPQDIRAILHELRVHQIELELQNEELLRVQGEVQAEKERYLGLFELAPVGYVVVDKAGAVIESNRAAETLLGLRPGTLADQPFTRFILPEAEDVHLYHIRRRLLLKTGQPQAFELRMRHAEGPTLWVHLTAILVGSHRGNPATYLSLTDVTSLKQAESALRESDTRLRESQKMESIGQLAGGIAHDFNNLLTAILGYAELVLANPTIKNLAVSDDVKEIKLAAERASELTRQILAFSRRQALQPVPVLLNTIIAGMEPLLRRTLGEHIDLVTHLDPDIEHVAVDVHQFEHVVINLALNARDAMSNGGRLLLETMDVELDEDYCLKHADASPGRYVMLSVLDTGAGMDDNTKSHMFEPFFTTKGPGQGTGLGLSTVYGIVRQSGGTIEVLSEAGKGTELRVYLPRICRPPEIIPEPLSPAPHIHGAETILVVEDEDALRALVVRVLRGLGYEVFSAGDAEEALGLMTTHGAAVDLLLTDVILRGPMQGNDLVRILEPAWPDLRILYMSGYSRDTIIHSGRVNPGVNLLEKPFTPESLAAKLRDTLDQQR